MSRQWDLKYLHTLLRTAFCQSNDCSLFIKEKDGKFIALLVNIDDIMITGNCEETIKKRKEYLNSKFHIKDLGSRKYFLGWDEILRSNTGICLTKRNMHWSWILIGVLY